MEQKFFICEHCGNIIAMVNDTGVPVMCCGQKMTQLVPNTVDAAFEKHVPVYTVEGNLVHVTVGSVEHPMLPEHYIQWISLHTKQGNQRKVLQPGAPATKSSPSTPTATSTDFGRLKAALRSSLFPACLKRTGGDFLYHKTGAAHAKHRLRRSCRYYTSPRPISSVVGGASSSFSVEGAGINSSRYASSGRPAI